MSKTPSRNEIESALDANKHRDTRQKSQQMRDIFEKSDHRERNVIGGDLTGISSRQKNKSGWFSFNDINYVNWIAGLIVILIAAVFFWPDSKQKKAEPTRSLQQTSSSQSKDVESPQPDQAIFSRNDDLDRANQFRNDADIEQKANTLLTTGKTLLRKGHYSTPPNENAIAKFKQVLALDPNNNDAQQGLDYIKSRYLAAGERAIEMGNIVSANANLKKIANIDNESDEYQALLANIELWQLNQQVNGLLSQAKEAYQKQQLILPAKQNARYFYLQVLELEPENADALAGIKTIASSFIDKAKQAINEGKREAAAGYLTTVSLIDPQNPIISELESAIQSEKPITTASNSKITAIKPIPKSTTSNSPKVSKTRQNSSNTPKSTKTPVTVSQERELIDRQYLQRGLEAYYRGDYEVARSLLKPLADKGVSRAQLRLGYMHLLGRGVEKNRAMADQIIRAALPAVQRFANEGRAWAQSDIGSLYEDGLVLPQNLDEALFWYQSAARQGYAGAQTNLGVMYAEGKGVTRSNKTAIEWFKKAAAQGDIAAQKNLKALNITP